jgi:hypothetical protein
MGERMEATNPLGALHPILYFMSGHEIGQTNPQFGSGAIKDLRRESREVPESK